MEKEELTPSQVLSELTKCKLQTRDELDELKEAILSSTVRLDNVEATLSKAEAQRTSFNTGIKGDIREVKSSLEQLSIWFTKHDTREDKKDTSILSELKVLTKQLSLVKTETDTNSEIIAISKRREEVADAVAAALKENNKIFANLKDKVILIVVGTLTTGALFLVWKIVLIALSAGDIK